MGDYATTWLAHMPDWGLRLLWTGVTIGAGYLIGRLVSALIVSRLVHLASRSRGTWDDILADELTRRVPIWALLISLWLALGHWDLRPDVRDLLEKVLAGLAGISIMLSFARVVTRLVVTYQTRAAPDVPVTALTQNLVRIVVLVVGILMIASGLGVEITAALTALGVGGLAVALALQEPLSNLFAGLFISLAGQIRVGDYVQLDSGQEGFVVDLDWRSTRIRQLSNNLVIVPNSKLSQAIVVNYGLPENEMAVLVQAGVDYASDLERVERITVEVATEVMQTVEGGVPTHEPFIRYHTFADSSINFSVILRGRQYVSQYLITHEFIKRLHARYEREGITIPFPIRTLAGRDPIPVTIAGRTRARSPGEA